MKLVKEPTKEEFEQKYDVTISDKAFEYLKGFLWEVCCAKNTTNFYKMINSSNVQELVNYSETNFGK